VPDSRYVSGLSRRFRFVSRNVVFIYDAYTWSVARTINCRVIFIAFDVFQFTNEIRNVGFNVDKVGHVRRGVRSGQRAFIRAEMLGYTEARNRRIVWRRDDIICLRRTNNRARLPFEVLEVRSSRRQRRADHGHSQRHWRERQQKLKTIVSYYSTTTHAERAFTFIIKTLCTTFDIFDYSWGFSYDPCTPPTANALVYSCNNNRRRRRISWATERNPSGERESIVGAVPIVPTSLRTTSFVPEFIRFIRTFYFEFVRASFPPTVFSGKLSARGGYFSRFVFRLVCVCVYI